MVLSTGYITLVSFAIFGIVTECKLITIEKSNFSSKNHEVKSLYGKLLTSIANVNEQRIDALKKFNALENYNVATGILRDSDIQDIHPIVVTLPINGDNLKATDGVLEKLYKGGPRNEAKENAVLFGLNENYDDGIKKFGDSEVKRQKEYLKRILNLNKNVKILKIYREGSDETESDDETQETEENIFLQDITHTSTDTELRRKGRGGKGWDKFRKKAVKKCLKSCKAAYKKTCKDYKCNSSMKKTFGKNCKRECKKNCD